MKRLFVILLLSMPLINLAQTVSTDAELGNRDSYARVCWVFQGFSVTSGNQPVISGSFSFRSGALSNNESPVAQAITSPWMVPSSGEVSFKMRFDTNGAQSRYVRLFFIPMDLNEPNFAGEPILISRTELTPNTTSVNNFSFAIPNEIVGKMGRFRISFNGSGGSNRAIVDDLSISGVYASDPVSGCSPLISSNDTDGDGVPDSEDDFPNDPRRAYRSFITNQKFSTLKFEDLWPAVGDYDFNDLVNDLRVSVISNGKNELVELVIESRTRAIGAAFRNGLGLELTGVSPDAVAKVSGHVLGSNTIHKMSSNQVESGCEFATIILFDDAFAVLERVSGGTGINVEPNRPMSEVKTQTITVTFEQGKLKSDAIYFGMLNPFMIINQERGREVHLVGKQPTKLADMSQFGKSADNSKLGTAQTYISKDGGLPWAIWVNESIPYMHEKVEIVKGFEKLKDWANSGGQKYQDWYQDKPGHINSGRVFRNN